MEIKATHAVHNIEPRNRAEWDAYSGELIVIRVQLLPGLDEGGHNSQGDGGGGDGERLVSGEDCTAPYSTKSATT